MVSVGDLRKVGSWWLVLCPWGLCCLGAWWWRRLSGCGDRWVFVSDLSFLSVVMARALLHFGMNILLCFSFFFHRMLPWGHICFIVSVQVPCLLGLVPPASPFTPYPMLQGTNRGVVRTQNLFSPSWCWCQLLILLLSTWPHLLSSTSQRGV